MRIVPAYICALAACHGAEAPAEVDLGPQPGAHHHTLKPGEPINPRLLRRFRPLEAAPAPTDAVAAAKIALGTQLFFDKRLSLEGNTSCNTCHSLDLGGGGADPRATSTGTTGAKGTRNAPTVYNAAWHIAQFWDGRSPDVESQAGGPMLNPTEMAMRAPADVTAVLRSIPGYRDEFVRAFGPDSVDFAHATLAIGAFERTLRTPSRWDAYLGGNHTALTPKELDGLKVFADVGCVQCHTGELVGGSMFQKAGQMRPWPNQADQGRYDITHAEADRMVFKVPSLRNVTLTAPYFHDGTVSTLPEAVRMMGRHQLDIELEDGEVDAIIAWLGTLTGTPPTITPPVLPPDGPGTLALISAR